MDITQINLQQYHEKAAQAIASFFGEDIEGAFAYPTFEDTVPKSVSIELDGVFPGDPFDMGTGQFHADLRFSAYVVVPFTAENHKLLVRRLATRLAGFLHGERFACPGAGDARLVGANPDDFSLPGKTGRAGATEEYEVWRVEWAFDAYIGDSVWATPGPPQPVEVWTDNNGQVEQGV